MRQLTVLMGIPASGKSTLVETMPNLKVVSTDQIRKDLTGNHANQDANADVFKIAHGAVEWYLRNDKDVLFDATNVTASARKALLDIADETDAEARLIVLHTPFDECVARNAERDQPVPDDVMVRMLVNFTRSLSEIGHETWDQICNWREW